MTHDALTCPGCNGTGRLAPKSHKADRYSPETIKLLQETAAFCAQFNVANQVKADTLEFVVNNFRGRFHMSDELRKCLVWCRDKGKRMVTTSRIQNWFSKAAKFAAEDKRRRQEQAQPAAPVLSVEEDLHREQREKVERDPRLQEFLRETATEKDMTPKEIVRGPIRAEPKEKPKERDPNLVSTGQMSAIIRYCLVLNKPKPDFAGMSRQEADALIQECVREIANSSRAAV